MRKQWISRVDIGDGEDDESDYRIMDERKARRNGKISERSEEKKGKRKRDGESTGVKKIKKKKE